MECSYEYKREQSSFLQKEKQNKASTAISLPKGVLILSDVKASGRAVRIKRNLLNNDNNNKNVFLKLIRKDGGTRSQKMWA